MRWQGDYPLSARTDCGASVSNIGCEPMRRPIGATATRYTGSDWCWRGDNTKPRQKK